MKRLRRLILLLFSTHAIKSDAEVQFRIVAFQTIAPASISQQHMSMNLPRANTHYNLVLCAYTTTREIILYDILTALLTSLSV